MDLSGRGLKTLDVQRLFYERFSAIDFSSIVSLDLSDNELSELPDCLTRLESLRALYLHQNSLTELPEWVTEWDDLAELTLGENRFAKFPTHILQLPLRHLDASLNQMREVPRTLLEHPSLESLDLSDNLLRHIGGPRKENLALKTLQLQGNPLKSLPTNLVLFEQLNELRVSRTEVQEIPEDIGDLESLVTLDLRDTPIWVLPHSITRLHRLAVLDLTSTRIKSLEPWLAGLPRLSQLMVADTNLPPEMAAAAQGGTESLLGYLTALMGAKTKLVECKLVLVGEGAVGKSSLLAALRNEEWVADRPTTHGVEIKSLELGQGAPSIAFNAWDFGGQKEFRPANHLFFSAPAIYLLLWKPREGPESGLVEDWITLIHHRVGGSARIIVVATHGGPAGTVSDLDRDALRAKFGEILVGFAEVDSKFPDERLGALKEVIHRAALALPGVQRDFPERWWDFRASLEVEGDPYLTIDTLKARASSVGILASEAVLLAETAHRTGRWVFFGEDYPTGGGFVVLKPEWLNIAINRALSSADIAASGGLVSHSTLVGLWSTYEAPLRAVFLNIMAQYELLYRVPDLEGEPTYLIAQLVPTSQPDLSSVWTNFSAFESFLREVEVFERVDNTPASPFGLMERLIVRLHRLSLGRDDVRDSLHWRRGVALQDRNANRALVRLLGTSLVVDVRGPFPAALGWLVVNEVRDLVDISGVWEGLSTRVFVRCPNGLCPTEPVGRGRFNGDKLIQGLAQGLTRVQCPRPDCDAVLDVHRILNSAGELGDRSERLERAIDEAEGRILASIHSMRVAASHDTQELRRELSMVDFYLQSVTVSLADVAADGPRLFSVSRVDKSILNPQITHIQLRITLWCEYSRLPVPWLSPGKGEYSLTVPRDWLVKAAPTLRGISRVLRLATPFLPLPDLGFSEAEQEHLAGLFGEIESLASSEGIEGEAAPFPAGFEEADIRTLQQYVREKDPSWGGLVRVREPSGRYVWMHPRFKQFSQSLVSGRGRAASVSS